jgi:hypothetical protein
MTHYGLDMAFCGGQQLHASIILLPLMEGGFCYTYRSKAISSWQTHGPRRRRTGHIPCWGEGLLAASNLLGRKLEDRSERERCYMYPVEIEQYA